MSDLLALLDQLDEARAKATPGPWYPVHGALAASNEEGFLLFDYRDVVLVDASIPEGLASCTADAALIVAAVNSLPELLRLARERYALEAAVLALADELEREATVIAVRAGVPPLDFVRMWRDDAPARIRAITAALTPEQVQP